MTNFKKYRRALNRLLDRFVSSLFCQHLWKAHVVYGSNPKTHTDVKQCLKCGKTITKFSGTRTEWLKHHGFDNC